jgi:hypothetical protein
MWLPLVVMTCGWFRVAAADDSSTATETKNHVGIYETYNSHSRRFVALSGIALGEVSPSIRMRLRILLVDVTAIRVQEILPLVQGKWAVVWAPNDIFIVCGASDIDGVYETSAYECRVFRPLLRRVPTDAEKKLVAEVFRAKYGIEPYSSNTASGG